MDITDQFSVTRPVESVWALFQNVPELARCLPGAELTSDNGDGTYDGRVSVKLGPISASFDGTATVEFDHESFTSNIKGRGVDRSGGSQGSVNVDVRLVEIEGGNTDVTIDASVTLAGPEPASSTKCRGDSSAISRSASRQSSMHRARRRRRRSLHQKCGASLCFSPAHGERSSAGGDVSSRSRAVHQQGAAALSIV